MDLCAIPTWEEAVDNFGYNIDFFVKSKGWSPLFIIEILNNQKHGSCKYFMIRGDSAAGESITSGPYGRLPCVSFNETFGYTLFSKVDDLKVVKSNVGRIVRYIDVLAYLKKNVCPTQEIGDSVMNGLRSRGIFL